MYILITSIFCCCVMHCVILAHNCFCNTLTNIFYIYRFRKNIEMEGGRGGTVVKVLRYKWEGRWFDSRWCHWNFSLT